MSAQNISFKNIKKTGSKTNKMIGGGFWKVVLDNESCTELTVGLPLQDAEVELRRALNEGLDAYLVEDEVKGDLEFHRRRFDVEWSFLEKAVGRGV